MRLFLFIISLLFTSSAFANNPGVSYQGRIFKPDGYPLEGANVQFRMQVRSPGAENCLLFEEIQTVNMTGSSGIFSITLNDGTGTRLDTPTYQVDRIFANRDVMTLDATKCAVGTSYTPNTGDGRKFVVYFKDETMAAYEPLPVMNLNYAPQAMYALEAQKVGTFAVNNILRAVDVSGNPVTAPALNPTQLTNLNNLLAGTSSQYATAADFSTVQTFAKAALPTCGAGEVLKANGTAFSCVVDSAGGSPAYSAITAATAANTIDNTSHAQTWNWSTATTQSPMSLSANALTTGSGLNLTTSSASLNSTNGLLNVANTGASTSGILARMQSNSTAGSGLTVLTNGNVGIGTASPTGILELVRDVASNSLPNGVLISTASNGAAQAWTGPDVIGRSAADQVSLPGPSITGANLLRLKGQSFASDGYFDAAGIVFKSDGNAAWGSHPGMISFLTTPSGSATPAERMTIDNSGKVGIGIVSPTSQLHVVGAAGTVGTPNASTVLTVLGGSGYASGNGTGGGVSITAGNGTGTQAGGSISLIAGRGGSAGGSTTLYSGGSWHGATAGSSYLQLGGSGTITSGSVLLSSGPTNGSAPGSSGTVTIQTPSTTTGYTASAGNISIIAGTGEAGGTGGSVSITAGGGGATNINGSNVVINPGAKGGTGADGNVILSNLRGYVGIGTTTPTGNLDVTGSAGILYHRSGAGSTIAITDYSGSQPLIAMNGVDGSVPTNIASAGPLRIYSGSSNPGSGSAKVVFAADTSGKVGIGTTTPQAALHVNGDVVLAKRSSEPVACSATYDGMIALTSQYTTCVCKGGATSWVRTSDGVTACVW